MENPLSRSRNTSAHGNVKAASIFSYRGTVGMRSLLLDSAATVTFSSKTEFSAGVMRLLFTSVECGGEIAENSSIASPNYPDRFPENAKCVWFLKAMPGKYVRLRVETVDLSNDGLDRVDVYQLSSLLKSYYGEIYNDTVDLGTHGRVEFYAVGGGQGRGFSMSVTYLDCEATLRGSGRVTSPGYPSDYPSGFTFCWRLEAEPGKRLLLVLQALRLAIYNDRLTMYAGDGRVKSYYRLDFVPHRELLDSSTALMLTADSAKGAPGFLLDFSSVECGKTIKGSGVVTSPGFPRRFSGNAVCIWNLIADPGKTVYLEIVRMHLPPSIQSLYISSTSFDAKFDGVTNAAEKYLIALDSRANLTLKSRLDNLGGSFQVNFTFLDGCGGYLSKYGAISAPSYGSVYPDNSRCTWNLKASPGKVLILEVETYLYSDNFDRVEIYEAMTLVKTYYGFNDIDVISIGAEGRVVFISNLGGRGRGFFISFTSDECGQTIKGSGVITSPGFPRRYAGNAVCIWDLNADPGKTVYLEIVQMDLKPSVQSLHISSTSFEAKFEGGSDTAEKYLIALDSRANVTLISHMDNLGGSFQVNFTSLEGCGGKLSKYGAIRAPSYGSVYPDNSRCTWNLRASPGKILILEVETYLYFDNFDRVEIYEGVTLVKTYYGFNEVDVTSIGAEGSVVFISNFGGRGRGFFIFFTSEECGGALSDAGVIFSGTTSFPYVANLFCKWNLNAQGKAIHLEFTRLDMEGSNDMLDIYENGTLHSSYFGTSRGKHAVVLRDRVNVVFQSDRNRTSARFHILFFSFVCGGRLRGPGTIVFTSPYYRYAYARNVTCTWTLEPLSPQRHVELKVIPVTGHKAFAKFLAYEGDRLAFSAKDIAPGYQTKLNSTVTISFTQDLEVRGASFAISVK